MITDAEVFNFCVPVVVLSELLCGIIVTKQGGCVMNGHAKAIKKLVEEEYLMAGIMYGNILSVTGRVGSVFLLVQSP